MTPSTPGNLLLLKTRQREVLPHWAGQIIRYSCKASSALTPAYETASISPPAPVPNVDHDCELVSKEQIPLHCVEPAEAKEPATIIEVEESETAVIDRTTGWPEVANRGVNIGQTALITI